MSDNDNVFSIISNNDTPKSANKGIPNYDYVIVDREGDEHFAFGFVLFTSQHIAVMRDTEIGALPVFVMPLDLVYVVELLEDDEEEEAAA